MPIEKEILRELKKANVVLLSSHERVDGDGVGSELALALLLRSMGKAAVVINDGEIPTIYKWLPGAEDANVCPAGWREDFDLCIAVDSASAERLGKVREKIGTALRIVNIDHHYSNTKWGNVNWADERVSSVGEMLYNFFRANHLEITKEIAVCLYTAILTDTGRFCFENTHESTFEAAADLIKRGVDAADVSRKIYRAEQPGVVRLKSLSMATLQTAAGGKVAMMHVTDDMHRATGTNYPDTQDFVDIPKSIAGVEVGILFRQIDHDGKTRVSLRTEGGVNADKLAAEFGGGGHRRAAGCTYDGGIEDARKAVLAAVLRHLKEAGIYGN